LPAGVYGKGCTIKPTHKLYTSSTKGVSNRCNRFPRAQSAQSNATALRVNRNVAPSIPSAPRAPARNSNAQLIYALDLFHHVLPSPWRMSPRAALSSRSSPSLLVAFSFLHYLFRPSPNSVMDVSPSLSQNVHEDSPLTGAFSPIPLPQRRGPGTPVHNLLRKIAPSSPSSPC